MKYLPKSSIIVLIVAVVFGLGWAAMSFTGNSAQVCEGGAVCNFNEAEGGNLGGAMGPHHYGDLNVHGGLGFRAKVLEIAQTDTTGTSTVTLTEADSGATVFLSGSSTIIVLPASSVTGAFFRFEIQSDITGGGSIDGNFIVQSAETANIYGAILTGGVDYACATEDAINFITDGDVKGDYVELLSDGTDWYIVGAESTTDAKITCTT